MKATVFFWTRARPAFFRPGVGGASREPEGPHNGPPAPGSSRRSAPPLRCSARRTVTNTVNVTTLLLGYVLQLAVLGTNLWDGVLHRRCYALAHPNATAAPANASLYAPVPGVWGRAWPCSPSTLWGQPCPNGSLCLEPATLPPARCSPGAAPCPFEAPPLTYDNIFQSFAKSVQLLTEDSWVNIILEVQYGWAQVWGSRGGGILNTPIIGRR